MRATATAEAFAVALSQAALAAIKTKGIEAFSATCIAAEGGHLSVSGHGHLSIAAKVGADVAEPGVCAVSAEKIRALVGKFPATAAITVEADDNAAHIISGNAGFRLPVIPWDTLPTALVIEAPTGAIDIAGSDLLMLLAPLPAAAETPDRPYLSGVLWHSTDGKLVAVATNGVQLLRTEIIAAPFSPGRDLIVPSEHATILLKIAKKAKFATVTLRRSKALLGVSAPGFTFTTKLREFVFPDYERVLPQACEHTATCERAALVEALARLIAVAGDDAAVALAWGQWDGLAELCLSLARAPEDGHDAIPATISGKAYATLTVGKLIDMLADFSATELRLESAGPRWPLIIRSGDKLAAISLRVEAPAPAA